MEEIKYSTLIDLGFKRTDIEDSIFFDQYGYNYFIVYLKLTKHFYINWDTKTRHCQLIRQDKDKNIKARFDICNLIELKKYIEFFTAK